MLDHCLHRPFHLATAGRHDLVIHEHDRPLSVGAAELLDALFHDAHRLAHFFHAYQVAIVTVAVLPDRNIEIEFGVAFVGLRLAQVPSGAGAAHHDAGKSPGPGVSELDDADIDVALLEN